MEHRLPEPSEPPDLPEAGRPSFHELDQSLQASSHQDQSPHEEMVTSPGRQDRYQYHADGASAAPGAVQPDNGPAADHEDAPTQDFFETYPVHPEYLGRWHLGRTFPIQSVSFAVKSFLFLIT